MIELLPPDIPVYNIPTEAWYQGKIIRASDSKSQDELSFYLMAIDLPSVDQAIDSFFDPVRLNHFDGQTNHFFNSSFLQEPTGPQPIILPSNLYEDEGLASILPKRRSGMFIWSQIDRDRKTFARFDNENGSKEMTAMSQLTTEWLGFDIRSKSEHIGNIYLCAPNPYFRDYGISLSAEPVGVFYWFNMRDGVEEKLSLRVIDMHGDNVALDKVFEISQNAGHLNLPHEPHYCETRVYNSHNDLIGLQRSATFIKSIQIGMSIKQADFHVKYQDPDKEFVVEKYAKEIPTIVGSPTTFNAPYYFKDAERQRKHIIQKKNNEFIFFPGGKTPDEKTSLKVEAKSAIRSIINQTKDTCYVCDPYFNVNDLIEYIFYIKDSGVKIRILNCKGSKFVDKEKASLLLNAINQYNSKPFQKIECRMLRGDSILHDRFLLSDLNVWYLGSSFSEFGNRATCLAKVPESSNTQILREVEKWYFNKGAEYTQLLQDYVKADSNE